MSERGLLRVFSLVMAILIMYIVIDCWADMRDMDSITDLQRRVGQLEQQARK